MKIFPVENLLRPAALLAWAVVAGLGAAARGDDRPGLLVVVGAPGSSEYDSQFRQWAGLWQAAALKASADFASVGLEATSEISDRERLRKILRDKGAEGREALWVVLIGHGTYDGKEAKFNLRGPDLTDKDLADWLAAVERPVVLVDCTAASAPFLNKVSGENRVVVAATKSGQEQNFARFGQYLAGAVADPAADLDKDGQVSLLEAFVTASGRLNEYYKSHSQLATEHPILDDNGDKLGTPADFFRGARAVRRAKDGAPPDGVRAHQFHLVLSDRERAIPPELRRRRDQIERDVAALRDQKAKYSEDDYYAKLEPLMVELSRLYAAPADQPKAAGRR